MPETDTAAQIRRTARTLLVNNGVDGVTLRAIARNLGITAPALYRYYDSHSALLQHLRRDISSELAARLSAEVDSLPNADGVTRWFAICRGFRAWSLANPREFVLVFASQYEEEPDPLSGVTEPFSRVFLSAIGHVLATRAVTGISDDLVPAAVRPSVEGFRSNMLACCAQETGFPIPSERLTLGGAYLLSQSWTRLYGHVALEVFGRLPLPVRDPDALFEAVLGDLIRDVGLNGRH